MYIVPAAESIFPHFGFVVNRYVIMPSARLAGLWSGIGYSGSFFFRESAG
jgi:hypothetical protein